MCWSGAQTGRSHCSLYHSAGRRASMSLLVLQLFISGFRGNDECLVASRAKEPCNLGGLTLIAHLHVASSLRLGRNNLALSVGSAGVLLSDADQVSKGPAGIDRLIKIDG